MHQPTKEQTKRERSRMHTESKIQRNNNASHRGGNTVWLRQTDTVSHRDGKPNAENRDAFKLTRNSLDTFHPRDKRCHVCRDFTAARCDHRATGYNLTEQRLQNRTCLFIPCNAWPDASVEKQKQVSVETYQITCWVQLAKLTHCD